ncbi:MAG: hypothetical protein ABJE95_02880 [Byssovorax sp.]
MKLTRASAFVVVALTSVTGCSGEPPTETTPPNPTACAADQELVHGACVDPALRYEPAARVDHDNVSAFGDPLTQLQLPDPPKSGFRIVAPPRKLAPGEEVEGCLSWPIPSTMEHIVYAGRLHATPGLHHSNVITKPVNPKTGPNPYPGCNPGADDPFSQLPEVIPDVLFANSTQVVGVETLAFPPGMGFRYDPTREIATTIHYLNTTDAPIVVEVAYDFFTMPEADLEREVAPFSLGVNDFLIPPHSIGKVSADCPVFGGSLVSMMPHTHKLAQDFTVDLISSGKPDRVLETGPFSLGSDIHVYDPQIKLQGVSSLRFECTFDNTTNHDVVYGIGENEMCILFGYMYPVKAQFVGFAPHQGDPCQSTQIGLFR